MLDICPQGVLYCCRMANGIHRTDLDRVIDERDLRIREVAFALKTTENSISRWRAGVEPRKETKQKLVRAINKLSGPEFDPVTLADLGWEETASV